ncbi:MAG TPA: hypothetical protein VNJ01_13335 [Bacteriovoracaceae bacterium]|nr:hypothetical protein [Bacteriovoracaceae bacterium]
MNRSFYQSLKPIVMDILGLSKDAIHIYIGTVAFLITFLLFKKKSPCFILLVPGILISIFLEGLDLWDDYRFSVRSDISSNIHDILNTNLIAVMVLTVLRMAGNQRHPPNDPQS